MTETSQELSEREQEILRLVATGASNKEIASQLFISANTVKVHLRNIYAKIDVVSRTEAAMYAIENGIVKSPAPEPEPVTVMVEKPAEPGRWQILWQRFWWAFVLLGLAVVVGLAAVIGRSSIFASPPVESSLALAESQRWQELAPLPVARAGLAAVAYDNAIYAIAGETEDGPSGLVERYDPATDSWTRLKDKPTAVTYVSAVLLGEKIFVPGGALLGGKMTDVLEVFDPRRDSWEKKAPLPLALSGYALAAYEGRLYLFGGWDGEQALDKVYIYDPDDDRWTEGTPMPTARAYAGAAEIMGRVYVMGGWDGERALDVNESYSPARDTVNDKAWEVEQPIPNEYQNIVLVNFADMLILLANNEMVDRSFSDLLYYSIPTKSWSMQNLNNMPVKNLEKSGYSALDGNIFIIGGNSNQKLVDNVVSFKVVYSVLLPFTVNQ